MLQAQLHLTNDTLPVRTLKNNALRTTNSSKVIRVFHPNHGMHEHQTMLQLQV